MKKDDLLWGGPTENDEFLNNIFAIAAKMRLYDIIISKYAESIKVLSNRVEPKFSSNKAFLMPYILSLYVIYKQDNQIRSDIKLKLQGLLNYTKGDKRRNLFEIEYLFSIAFFCDLFDQSADSDLEQIKAKAQAIALEILEIYENIKEPEYKAKFLYSLSALNLEKELKSLYQNRKYEIEQLLSQIQTPEDRLLLLRPYMLLNVHCNRKIVFGIIDYFKSTTFEKEERKIRQKLESYLLFLENKPDKQITIEKKDNEAYKLTIELSEDSVIALQKQSPSVPFSSMVLLTLSNCGFKRVYTVPTQEILQYQEYKKSKESDRFLQVNKDEIVDLIDDYATRITIWPS